MSHRAICVHVLICVALLVLILLGANQIPQDGVVLNLDHILYDFLFLNTIFWAHSLFGFFSLSLSHSFILITYIVY